MQARLVQGKTKSLLLLACASLRQLRAAQRKSASVNSGTRTGWPGISSAPDISQQSRGRWDGAGSPASDKPGRQTIGKVRDDSDAPTEGDG